MALPAIAAHPLPAPDELPDNRVSWTADPARSVLLVHDLYAGGAPREHPWQDEAAHAVHGGLWRTPYDPRSALGLAAIFGLAARQ